MFFLFFFYAKVKKFLFEEILYFINQLYIVITFPNKKYIYTHTYI